MLTDRPDNRRPLTWARNRIDVLLLEGRVFECPWTGRAIVGTGPYDLDHLIPLVVYPMNDLWNLVPADQWFNQRRKRDRLPTDDALATATPRLELAYGHYQSEPDLAHALNSDVRGRFSLIGPNEVGDPSAITRAVAAYLSQLADTRNIARF
jgi:hypothetical protein